MNRIIATGCDHAAFVLKETIKKHLQLQGYEVRDFGTFSGESVDYPDMIHPLAREIDAGRIERGIILCGSGVGVSMVANKYPKVRCALCWNVELAKLCRQHNDANVMALGARFIAENDALAMVDAFLDTPFEGGRHQGRVEKIAKLVELF
ncbi:MAG: ribose 5-phosphate isomerase B [Bacteroidales bacterium]|nr:ribose 5-phosphate isomerase B [Bacteroidales bacterium]